MEEKSFHWPRALWAIICAAEHGEIERRALYPVEVAALAQLVAGAELAESPAPIGPGAEISRHDEQRGAGTFAGREVRATYKFAKCLSGGRILRAVLLTRWISHIDARHGCERALRFRPGNVEHAEVWIEGAAS